MRSKGLLAMLVTVGLLLGGCHRPAFLGGETEMKGPVVCEGRYALCVAAACLPIPSWNAKTGKMETIQATRALCECAVANGPSLGDLPCAARAPQGEGKYLVSTFSFGETATHPAMSCPGGTPWAYCYDQPCVVDPKDPSKAQCTCQLRTSGEFQTLGGNCDKSKCGTLWSGAAADAMAGAAKLLASGEGLKAVPANSCP
jgi:hypothetical protein